MDLLVTYAIVTGGSRSMRKGVPDSFCGKE